MLAEDHVTDEDVEHAGLSLASFCQMGYVPSCELWLRWLLLVGVEPEKGRAGPGVASLSESASATVRAMYLGSGSGVAAALRATNELVPAPPSESHLVSVFGDGVQQAACRLFIESVNALGQAAKAVAGQLPDGNDSEDSGSDSGGDNEQSAGLAIGLLAVHEGDGNQLVAVQPLRLRAFNLLNAVVQIYRYKGYYVDRERKNQRLQDHERQTQSRSRANSGSAGSAASSAVTLSSILADDGLDAGADLQQLSDRDREREFERQQNVKGKGELDLSVRSAERLLHCFCCIFDNEKAPSKSLQFLLNSADDGADYDVSFAHRTTRLGNIINSRACDNIRALSESFDQDYQHLTDSFPMESIQRLLLHNYKVVEHMLDQDFSEKTNLLSSLRTILQRFVDNRSLSAYFSSLASPKLRESIVHYLCCDMSHTRNNNADVNVASLSVVLRGVVNTQYLMGKKELTMQRYVMLVFLRMQALGERLACGTLSEQNPSGGGISATNRDRFQRNIAQFWKSLRAQFFSGDTEGAKTSLFRLDVIQTEALRILAAIPEKRGASPAKKKIKRN